MADLEQIEAAIVRTVAYVDVFDYPLTADEVHRYLVETEAPAGTIHDILQNGRMVPHKLSRLDEYFMLPGREQIIETRRRRRHIADKLWPQAIRYGQALGALPFVKMVAVTGSLAVDNAEHNADIDYLVVTEPGRLWLTRALTLLYVRLAERHNITLCPNYFVTQDAMTFEPHNLYMARELAQMVPLTGLDIYNKMRRLNAWADSLLPNAAKDVPRAVPLPHTKPSKWFWKLMELGLRTPAGAWLEKWEMDRKIRKFKRQYNLEDTEAAFTPHWCKGHFDNHANRTLTAYSDRLQTLN